MFSEINNNKVQISVRVLSSSQHRNPQMSLEAYLQFVTPEHARTRTHTQSTDTVISIRHAVDSNCNYSSTTSV